MILPSLHSIDTLHCSLMLASLHCSIAYFNQHCLAQYYLFTSSSAANFLILAPRLHAPKHPTASHSSLKEAAYTLSESYQHKSNGKYVEAWLRRFDFQSDLVSRVYHLFNTVLPYKVTPTVSSAFPTFSGQTGKSSRGWFCQVIPTHYVLLDHRTNCEGHPTV